MGVLTDPTNGALFGSKEARAEFIEEVVCKTNRELYGQEFDTKFSGSTLVFVLLLGNLLVCGNVGDSRAVIGSQKKEGGWMAANLSRDHKPHLPDEKERIINSDGRISPMRDAQGGRVGPARVWHRDGRYPGLAMSRSLGDRAGKGCGVVETPEVRERLLKDEDRILIVGSDGVWELMSSAEAVRIAIPFWKENNAKGACDKLVDEATARWKKRNGSIDDITCIVMFINSKQS